MTPDKYINQIKICSFYYNRMYINVEIDMIIKWLIKYGYCVTILDAKRGDIFWIVLIHRRDIHYLKNKIVISKVLIWPNNQETKQMGIIGNKAAKINLIRLTIYSNLLRTYLVKKSSWSLKSFLVTCTKSSKISNKQKTKPTF